MDAAEILAEYRGVIARAKEMEFTWAPSTVIPDGPPGVEASSRVGTFAGARVVVVCFSDHGRVGHDGTLFMDNTLCHLLPGDAEYFWKLAEGT